MADTDKILVDVEQLESLLPGKHILDTIDLERFNSFLSRLWDQGRIQGKDIPDDFLRKLFALQQYFRDYITRRQQNSCRPTKAEEIERLTKLLPPVH